MLFAITPIRAGRACGVSYGNEDARAINDARCFAREARSIRMQPTPTAHPRARFGHAIALTD
jgi:hypothetical protein